MATVKLKIPTLVKDAEVEGKVHYYLRPLFLNYPVAAHRRYDNAVAQYQKEVRQLFKGFSFDRQNAPQLLWLLFRPELQYLQYDFGFNLGRQYVSGPFGLVSFTLKEQLFICLPGLNNFLFMAAPGSDGKVDIEQEAKRVIHYLLRQLRQEAQGELEPEIYFASKREFITTIEVPVNIGQSPFQFEEPANNWLFSTLIGETSFDGAVEAERTGQDLNALFPAELHRAYYREEWVSQVYQILFHPNNTPLAIVGPEGVGKHTLIHEAIWRYENGFYQPKKGRSQRVWHIDPTRIIAGMSIVGMWQKRFESIISFIRQPAETAKTSDKMLIDNPVALLRIGKSAQNNMTLSDVLRPYLEKRQLQLTLLATPEEWNILQEKGRRFSNLFQVIRLDEPNIETATRIILQKRRALEREQDCTITIQAVQQLLAIQRNYLRNKPLPGSVIKLMQQLAVKYRYRQANAPEVREEFRAFSGLEERIFDSSQQLQEQEVHNLIAQELVGQPQAVEALSNIVHIIKAKLADKQKPLASFLFIGPTGVGKTQAAKVLAQYLMGNEAHLIRFDMNEYIDAGALQRLIGDEYNPEGQLTGTVRYRPFGIILLDEIEKAHPLVHDLLLQLLDDGRLTDSLGRTVDFTNTIIIMTSNVGARQAASQLGYVESPQREAEAYRRAMENEFRPEFINRIGQVVIFKALALEHILDIARLQIRELLQRDGFVRRTTILNISKEALEWVARRGFDARMGGRALKRQIERDLTTLSAEQLISTSVDTPILFDILLEGGHLTPRIRPLDFVSTVEEEWLPRLPEETRGKGFYNQLLHSLASVKARLDEYEEQWGEHGQPLVYAEGQASSGLGWQYYQFKDKVEDTRAAIRDISLAFRDRNYKYRPAIPYRLKPTGLVPKKDWSAKGVRENLKDRLFQEEGLREVSDAYQYGATSFDSLKTEFLNHFLDVALLKLQLQYVFRDDLQKARLTVSSYISGMGSWEVEFLLQKYAQVLAMLDIPHKIHPKKGFIEAEAYGLLELFKGEEGVHLFYRAHQNPIPVIVSLQSGLPEEQAYRVVRIYNNRDTLTDLRTGYSNALNITPNEFKLLLYAGLAPELRPVIDPMGNSGKNSVE
ncbi:MAG: ATP-dependent Clp protease ATP-binding subunit [Phaeodactylibacter sp.]|nr:ATP-dependent Clp protease ATP-binding subunit [Phaeodactylibacter sp.]MCB9301087.1 ATP-dependent Clp protease ATP-binding subunit [Lewinellaceae bacterium]